MPVLCMEFHSSGLFVATGSADRTVRIWDLSRGHCTHIYRDHVDIVQQIKFYPNQNEYLLFSSGDDARLNVYDLYSSSSSSSSSNSNDSSSSKQKALCTFKE